MNSEIIQMKIEEHENNIKRNSEEIGLLKMENVSQNGKIDNLCEKMIILNDSIKGLVVTLKWGFGIIITAAVPVFVFLISKK